MIIKCPSCERRFELQRKAPTTFCCPKCGYRVPFVNILEADKDTGVLPSQDSVTSVEIDENLKTVVVDSEEKNLKTRFIPELQQDNPDQKTIVVKNLQQSAMLQIVSGGQPGRVIPIASGRHTLGRLSSDSKATIKIAPDITMSRIHAYLSTINDKNGTLQYILKPANQHNPVLINNRPVVFGTAALLRSGDIIVMGSTTMRFKLG